ncbi:MAG: polyphosphate kinase 1, partial [Clostridia bacterium]|nr:polyphosphate kinase 1 [Clostridia bacterium]
MASDTKNYISRELSWLEFNHRVLMQGLSGDNPLFERMKFLSIVTSNLDEFYMIRVGSLREQMRAGYDKRDAAGLTAEQQLAAISQRTRRLYSDLYNAYDELLARLAELDIRIIGEKELTAQQREYCKQYFKSHIYPVLSPVMIARRHPLPFIPGKGLNLAVMLLGADGKRSFATVQLPSSLERMIRLPSESGVRFISVEDIVRMRVGKLFPSSRIGAVCAYRITRNGDLDVDTDEAGDLLSAVKKSLRNRRRGGVVRLEIEPSPHRRLLETLQKKLKVRQRDIFFLRGPINLNFLMKQLYALEGYDEYKYSPLVQKLPTTLEEEHCIMDIERDSIFERISRGDILLYHPFDSFEPVVRLLSEAADDPQVAAIKITLYRLSDNSPIVDALSRAARSGKQVTAFIEARARFDEENNIEYGGKLEKSGVNVIYGLPHLKTHSKIMLILRRENGAMKTYMQLGTGNYNDVTARLYTDYSLLTANEVLGGDAVKFFHTLTGGMACPELKKLIMAPFSLRDKFTQEIRRERKRAKRGEEAFIFAKFNSLVDEKIIRELYKASCAGVKIRLLVRGI